MHLSFNKCNLVFAGLARDCARTVEKNIASILSLCDDPRVESLQLFIAENDSQDQTRSLLASIERRFEQIQLVLLPSLDTVFPSRVARIAYCRQYLLGVIADKVDLDSSSNILYIPIDLDSEIFSTVNGDLFVRTCLLLLSNACLDAIFPSSSPFYYDVLALRASGWCSSDCMYDLRKFTRFGSQFISLLGYLWLIARRQKSSAKLAATTDLIPVQSAFGGLGIYRAEAISVAKYFNSFWSHEVYAHSNEHVIFNGYIHNKVIATKLTIDAPKEHIQLRIYGFRLLAMKLAASLRDDLISAFARLSSWISFFAVRR